MSTIPYQAARRQVLERVPQHASRLFSRHVPGNSFADLGCMWNAHGAYTFCAELLGAVPPILAMDQMCATAEYHALHRALESQIVFKQGDILQLDPSVDGIYDVVFCSGVLYHMPDPMLMLHKVAGITRRSLLLCTHTIEGDQPVLRFYPHSPDPEPLPWETAFGMCPESRDRVRYGDWTPWWFGPTEQCVCQMLRCVGFEIAEVDRYCLELDPGQRHNPRISTFAAHRLAA